MAKKFEPAIKISYDTLTSLLGKQPDDPAVAAMLKKAGKHTVKSDFIIAKEAGFDFSLGKPPNAKKKVMTSLFLFSDGKDGHRGYADLPAGFAWGTRVELLAKAPAPESSFKIGKGKVPVTTADVSHDTWNIDGMSFSVTYREGVMGYINVAIPVDQIGGRDLSTHPLHFETKPADAPPEAELVGMGLLVAWALDRCGAPAKHSGSALAGQLAKREITPRTFLKQACSSTITTLDVHPKLGDFLWGYTNRMFLGDDDDTREKLGKQIAKLLLLKREDELAYPDDFLGTFKKAVKNPFHVPDSWESFERIAPILDARWADYQATKFQSPHDVGIYEKAAKLRDAREVKPTRTQLAKATVPIALAEDLVELIGKSLKDPHVKDVLTSAGLPIGKKIDQQANPALGIAYMGTKFAIDGSKQLGVDAIYFFASKQKSYIRGMGAEVEFVGYPSTLPNNLLLGESRAAVAQKLGKPGKTYDECDYWETKTRRLVCTFARKKLVELYIGRMRDD